MYSGSGRGGEVACEQALRGALAARREKEGDLATTSLEFEYPHRKSRCKMLIGGYDISNDIITLGTFFSMFVYICARSCFALIGGNLTAQSAGSHGGIGGGVQISKLSFLFPSRRREPLRAFSQASGGKLISHSRSFFKTSRTSVISIPCQDLSESRFPSSRSY